MNITDEIFFSTLCSDKKNRVFESNCDIPIVLQTGYDASTGKSDLSEFSMERAFQLIMKQEMPTGKQALLTLAKSIVQNVPRMQNDTTLTEYCHYLLRLLWMRENWLIPLKRTETESRLDRNNNTIIKREIVTNNYTDIEDQNIIPLLCNALMFFCNITTSPDFPKRIIDLAKERGYLWYQSRNWQYSGKVLFCSLTSAGKRVAEHSDSRLLQLTGTTDLSVFQALPDDSSEHCDAPVLQMAASAKGNRPTSLAEIKAEEAEIAWADEPADVRIVNTEPTPDALLIVDAIRRLPGYREQQAIAPPDESKGRWVPLEEAVRIRNVSEGTLADYRTNGTKSLDGLSGIDSQGFHWQRKKSNSPTEYFIPDDSDRTQ